MNCCLCENYYETEKSFHTHIKGLAICYACYSDMDFDTEIAFHNFIENLIRQIPDKSEIYASAFDVNCW
jgi:hypothetical protein